MVTTAVEKIDDTKIKLQVTVPADRVTKAIDAAVNRLASTMRIPGFRPGKAPLKVIESRLGKGAVENEAARETLPSLYTEALQQAEITPVGTPQFDVEEFARGSEGIFTATVDVRPDFKVPEFAGITVEHPEWELTDEELNDNLDAMRDRFAEVDTVDRPARKGDFVTLTLTARKSDGTVVEEASAEDLLYPIPEEDSDSELDGQLEGAEAGAILKFDDVLGADYPDGLAGQQLSFTAIVKEVKSKSLPDLDDDFALTASEFDTIEELKDDLRNQIGLEKRQMARANLRGKVVETLAEMVDIPLPESLVAEEQRFRLNQLAHQAEHNGLDFEQFLGLASGGDPQALLDQIKAEAEQTVKAQLIVDEVGQDADITVQQEDLGQEIARQSMRMNRDPKEVAELMLHPDRIGALYADAYRRKAIDHIMAAVEITNAPPEEPEPEPDSETSESETAEQQPGQEHTEGPVDAGSDLTAAPPGNAPEED